MKYPANTGLLIEAKMYAVESIKHTMDYDGWRDAHAKSIRIMTGNYCQLWLAEYCRLNGVACEKDKSSPYIADKGDLKINGWNIDSKASMVDGLEGQISPHLDNQPEIDYYAFFKTDKSFSYIEPLGFIRRCDVESSSTKVQEGEIIPGTGFKQRFKYSYFVKREEMLPFNKTLKALSAFSKSEYLAGALEELTPF